jgi:hypothetical protein
LVRRFHQTTDAEVRSLLGEAEHLLLSQHIHLLRIVHKRNRDFRCQGVHLQV